MNKHCLNCANAYVFDSEGCELRDRIDGPAVAEDTGIRCLVHNWSVGGQGVFVVNEYAPCRDYWPEGDAE